MKTVKAIIMKTGHIIFNKGISCKKTPFISFFCKNLITQKINHKLALVTLVAIVVISCSRIIDLNTEMNSLNINYIVPAKYTATGNIIHIYVVNKISGATKSYIFTKIYGKILLENVSPGLYDIYSYIFTVNTASQLITKYFSINNDLEIKEDYVSILNEFTPVIPIVSKIETIDNTIKMTFETASLYKILYISSLSVKNDCGKYIKKNSVIYTDNEAIATFTDTGITSPEIINISFSMRNLYDKEKIEMKGYKITTTRFENHNITLLQNL